ncbi:transposase [Nitratidesulfovibrio vulgaris]|nr:transposase [Nitratidesulfovibrio vulgaris]WCB45559.1 transposase [Nitratidesulfovibrio vulgaris]
MTVDSLADATFYKWRSKHGGLNVSEARRLQGLEEENQRLKPLVAEQALDFRCSKKSWEKRIEPAESRLAVHYAIEMHGYSERRACQLMEMNRRPSRRPPISDRDAELRTRLCDWPRSADGQPTVADFLSREDIVANHKSVERVHRLCIVAVVAYSH